VLAWLLPACLLFPLAGGALLAVLLLDAMVLSLGERAQRKQRALRSNPS